MVKKIGKRLAVAESYINDHWKWFLVVIHVLQLIGLSAFLIIDGVGYDPDTAGYTVPAESFMEKGVMLDANEVPILSRTPGYPLMLAVIYSLTGKNDSAVAVIQIIMTILSALMLFYIVSRYTNHCMGVLACLFYASDYVYYGSAVSILTDTPFSFFMVLAAYLLVRYLEKHRKIYLITCFFALNYALLVRPTIMYFNMILAIVLVVCTVLRKVSWKNTVAYLLIFTVFFGGWSMRNAAYFGRPIYTSIRDVSAYLYYAPLLYEQEEGVSREEAEAYFSDLLEKKYPQYETMNKLEQMDAYKDIGTSYIKKHVFGYIRLNLKGLVLEMIGPNAYNINRLAMPSWSKKLMTLFVVGMLSLSYVLYAVGFFVNVRRFTWMDWLILLTVGYLMASTAVLGYSRFRIAFYPLSLMGTFVCWRNAKRSS